MSLHVLGVRTDSVIKIAFRRVVIQVPHIYVLLLLASASHPSTNCLHIHSQRSVGLSPCRTSRQRASAIMECDNYPRLVMCLLSTTVEHSRWILYKFELDKVSVILNDCFFYSLQFKIHCFLTSLCRNDASF